VGFEATIAASERAKTVHALDRSATVTGFIDRLQVVTTNNHNTIADLHTTNHITLSLLSLFSLFIIW
jgi:hypothetical protein